MNNYYNRLEKLMDLYAHEVYRATKDFPKEELYGSTSQLRRSALSVILNFTEGYARRTGNACKVFKNFINISFGSLKESKYLLQFSLEENYLSQESYNKLNNIAEEISAMLYKIKY